MKSYRHSGEAFVFGLPLEKNLAAKVMRKTPCNVHVTVSMAMPFAIAERISFLFQALKPKQDIWHDLRFQSTEVK